MPYTENATSDAIPIVPLSPERLDDWIANSRPEVAAWLKTTGFKAKPGDYRLVPGEDGSVAKVVIGVEGDLGLWSLAGLPGTLPAGVYRLAAGDESDHLLAALGWGLGAYRFNRYREQEAPDVRLQVGADTAQEARHLLEAQCLVRDLVNTPTEDMGPEQTASTPTRASLKATNYWIGIFPRSMRSVAQPNAHLDWSAWNGAGAMTPSLCWSARACVSTRAVSISSPGAAWP